MRYWCDARSRQLQSFNLQPSKREHSTVQSGQDVELVHPVYFFSNEAG
jgi:hypothetical protein